MTGRYLASPGMQLKVTCILRVTPCTSANYLPIPNNVCKTNRHVLVGRVLVSLGRGPKKSNSKEISVVELATVVSRVDGQDHTPDLRPKVDFGSQ